MRRTIFKGSGPYEKKGWGYWVGSRLLVFRSPLWLDGKKITRSVGRRVADHPPLVRVGFVEVPDEAVHHAPQLGFHR